MALPVTAKPRDGGVVVHDTARAIRIGGQTVLPGEARVVPLALAGRAAAEDVMPVWVAAGSRPGPRVTIIAAPRGFEVGAARVAAGLRTLIDASSLQGGIVVAPVFRPGGRFAARGRPVRSSLEWKFPGDPGGNRHAREAFAIFSDLVVGSSLLIVLGAAEPGLCSALTIQGDFDDPRVRRLSAHATVTASLHRKAALGSLAAAAADMGAAVVELSGPGDATGDHEMTAAIRGFLGAAGTAAAGASAGPVPAAPAALTQSTWLRAPAGGLLETLVGPGALLERGAVLARLVPPLLGRSIEVTAPHDGVVVQATTRSGVRARAPLFLVARVSRATLARGQRSRRQVTPPGSAAELELTGAASPPGPRDAHPLHVGWVERVSLPSLGVDQLRAKIDTGARTSALHVTRMTAVGTTEGPHRRPILELTLPAGSRRGAPPATVRVLVRDYVQVKDTSGRTERRPVIETTLRLGTLERRIRVTLTNRGDMLFPLLIGRTALGAGVVVDPARRLLLHATTSPRRREPRAAGAVASRPPRAPAAAGGETVTITKPPRVTEGNRVRKLTEYAHRRS